MRGAFMKYFLFIFTLFFSIVTFSADKQTFSKEEFIQVGDMFVPVQSILEDGEIVSDRAVKDSGVRLWPQGIIWYEFSRYLSSSQRNLFLQACRQVGEFANISCRPRPANQRDYIFVQNTNENVCGSSYLGVWGGRQPFNIRCWRSRTLQHELMHALGISHEHNRHDRDDYLVIVWDNIDYRIRSNFQRVRSPSHSLNYYDYKSVMHYGSYSGSSNGGLTFYRRDLGPDRGKIEQSNQMSYGDHYMLYALYGGTRP